ncbi:LPS assembly lipoprotein LptE [Zavarzinia compransoris]|uniref:LPS assembly lipoprotein LptE n=1 Tax=Zavarzinia compransoris TaxID=1264899 RepID=UPI001414D76E|nr:LPS assembly lipoprotein LptE [Zavarzinia compransoris]
MPPLPRAARRRSGLAAVLAAGLLTAACGFQPMYGARSTSAEAEALLGSVAVAPISSDRNGQILRNDLIDKISAGRTAQNPRYRLDVELETLELGGLIQTDASITRYTVTMRGKIRLVDVASGTVVMNEMARATTSYSVPLSEYASITAQQDAHRRASGQLADEIRSRIASFLETRHRG